MQGTGVQIIERFLGYQRKDVDGFLDFFGTIQSAFITNVQRAFVNVMSSSDYFHICVIYMMTTIMIMS